MTEDQFEAMREDSRLLKEHVNDLLQALSVATETIVNTVASQRQLEKHFERLAEAQFRADERLDRQAEVQLRTDERLDRLAKSQAQTDETVAKLSVTVERLSETVDRYLNARLNGHSQN